MLATYAERLIKVHRHNNKGFSTHVDTVDLTSSDNEVSYLGKIFFLLATFTCGQTVIQKLLIF